MIDVLEALEDPGIEAHTSVVLAYNVDLLVYDKLLRRRLASAGATSQVVFCDATAYAGALDAVDATSKIGLAYSVTPVRAVGAFHPKAYLLLGARRGRLIIGSGNASLGGLVRNAEVFGSFEFDEERDAAPHAAFAAIFGLCRRLAGAAPPAVRVQLERAEKRSPWLQRAPAPDGRLVHLGGPGQPRLIDAMRSVGGKIRRVIALSSSFDRQLAAVAELARMGDGTHETVVVVQSQRCEIDGTQLGRLPVTVRWTEFVDPRPSKRGEPRDSFAHAKLYIVETDAAEHLFFGSANLSSPALLDGRNVEVLVQLPPAAPGEWVGRLALKGSLEVDVGAALLARRWTGDPVWSSRPIHLAGVEWSARGWVVATEPGALAGDCMLALGGRHDREDMVLALRINEDRVFAPAEQPLSTARFAWLVDGAGAALSAPVAITWPEVTRPSIGRWPGAHVAPALLAMKNGELFGPVLLEFLDQARDLDLLAVRSLGRAAARDGAEAPTADPAAARSPESFYTSATPKDEVARSVLGDRGDIELLAYLIQPVTSHVAPRLGADDDDEEGDGDVLAEEPRGRAGAPDERPPDPLSARRWRAAGRRLTRRLERAATSLGALLRHLPADAPLPPHLLARQAWMSRIAAFVAGFAIETESEGHIIAVEPEVLAHYVLRCAAPLAGDASHGLLGAVESASWSELDGRTLAESLRFFIAVCAWAVAWFEGPKPPARAGRPTEPVRTIHEAAPLFVLARLLVAAGEHVAEPDFLDAERHVSAWAQVEAHAIDDAYGRARVLAAWLRDVEGGLAAQPAGAPVAGSVVLIRKYGVAVVLAVRADNLWAAVLGRERPFVTFKTSQVQTLQPPSIGGLWRAEVRIT